MRQFSGWLTITDLDGTLINSNHQISEENKKAIKDYVRLGGLFAIATGRTEDNVKPYLEGLEINCPSILYNGAAIYDFTKKEFLRCKFIERRHLIKPLKQLMQEQPELCVQIFTPGMLYVVSEGPIDPSLEKEGQQYQRASFEQVAKLDWIKLLLYDTRESLKQIEPVLLTQVPERVISTVFSQATYLEVLPYGVTKGSALLELMQLMGIAQNKVTAIGDYCNDIEMIEVAGLGVATQNAHPELKKVADLTVVSNDHHALQHLIEEILTLRVG